MALITNNISGSSAGGWRLGLTGTVAIANPGVNSFPAMPGNDVSFFVSGAIDGKKNGTQTVSVFGGDAVISGSLTVGTGSVTITSNEVQFLGGIARIFSGSGGLTFSDASGAKTLSSLSTGGGDVAGPGSSTDTAIVRFSGTTGKNIQNTAGVTIDGSNNVVTSGSFSTKNASGTTVANITNTGEITGSNSLFTGNVAINGGNVTSTAGTFNLLNGVTNLKVGTSATAVTIGGTSTTTSIFGNLYVSGTVVSVDSSNMKVSDPVVLLASGSAGPSAKSALAFASGSTVTSKSLIFGAGIGSDVLAAARQDVQDGNLAQASLSFTDLVPVRASSFQVGGATAVVTSSDGLALTVGGTSTTTLSGSSVNLNASSTGFMFQQDGSAVLAVQSGSYGALGNVSKVIAQNQALLLGGADTKDVYVSGSQLFLNTSNKGVSFQRDGTQYGNVKGGAGGSTFSISAVDAGATSKVFILTGSAVTIGANSAPTDFTFAGVSLGQISSIGSTGVTFGSATGKTLTISGSSGALSVVHGTNGVQFVQEIGQPTYLTISSGSAIGALVNAPNNGNTTVASGQGSTTMTVSGSSVNLNGGTVNLKKDGTTYAFVGTSPDAQPLNGLMPATDMAYNLGSPALRWQNMYTGDLHLRNERGDYTLIEEEDFLSIRFNKTGKRYKFLLEPVPELDEK